MRNRKRERPAPRGWRRDAGSVQALPQRPLTCTGRVKLDEGEAKAQLGKCTLRVDSRRGWPRPRTRSRCVHCHRTELVLTCRRLLDPWRDRLGGVLNEYLREAALHARRDFLNGTPALQRTARRTRPELADG